MKKYSALLAALLASLALAACEQQVEEPVADTAGAPVAPQVEGAADAPVVAPNADVIVTTPDSAATPPAGETVPPATTEAAPASDTMPPAQTQ